LERGEEVYRAALGEKRRRKGHAARRSPPPEKEKGNIFAAIENEGRKGRVSQPPLTAYERKKREASRKAKDQILL